MKKGLIGVVLLVVIGGAVYFAPKTMTLLGDTSPEGSVTLNNEVEVAEPARNPNKHDADDIDFAKKKLLHHQLATLIADKAKTDATSPEIRQFAEETSREETRRANVYATLLDSWNESYMNITDFPEKDGCNGYPTFPGMISHLKVGEYRLSNGAKVDATFFDLMIEHHQRAEELMEFEGKRVGYGELLSLAAASQAEYEQELSGLETLREELL